MSVNVRAGFHATPTAWGMTVMLLWGRGRRGFGGLRDDVPVRRQGLRERLRRFQMHGMSRLRNDDAARGGNEGRETPGDLDVLEVTSAGQEQHVASKIGEAAADVLVRALTHAAKGVGETGRKIREPVLAKRGQRRGRKLPLRLEERQGAPVIREPLHAALLDPSRQSVVRLATYLPGVGILDSGRGALQ